jgi:hypothetical protein
MTLHHAVLIYLHLGLIWHNHFTFMRITSAHTELWAIQTLCPQAPVGVCCNSILKQAMGLSIMGSNVFHETSKYINLILTFAQTRNTSEFHILHPFVNKKSGYLGSQVFGLTKLPILCRRLPTKISNLMLHKCLQPWTHNVNIQQWRDVF